MTDLGYKVRSTEGELAHLLTSRLKTLMIGLDIRLRNDVVYLHFPLMYLNNKILQLKIWGKGAFCTHIFWKGGIV